MEKFTFEKGSTSKSIIVHLKHATTGMGLTGLAFNTASFAASYARFGADRTAITLATQTEAGAYSSGGFVEIDATNMPGAYRFDIPDAVLATGSDGAQIIFKGATNLLDKAILIELVDAFNSSNPIEANIRTVTNNAITAAALNADAGTEIAAAVFARAFSAAYGSYTFDELMKLMVAVLLGKASGLAGTTATYRNLADNADVVVATVDADGNRTAVTKTP